MGDSTIHKTLRQLPATELHSWADREWRGGVEVQSLSALDRFTVRTRNTTYEFTVMAPQSAEVLVRGGRFFPEHTRVRVAGCSLGGAFLKIHAIYPGFLMELQHGGERIVTTRVQRIVMEPAGTPQ